MSIDGTGSTGSTEVLVVRSPYDGRELGHAVGVGVGRKVGVET